MSTKSKEAIEEHCSSSFLKFFFNNKESIKKIFKSDQQTDWDYLKFILKVNELYTVDTLYNLIDICLGSESIYFFKIVDELLETFISNLKIKYTMDDYVRNLIINQNLDFNYNHVFAFKLTYKYIFKKITSLNPSKEIYIDEETFQEDVPPIILYQVKSDKNFIRLIDRIFP